LEVLCAALRAVAEARAAAGEFEEALRTARQVRNGMYDSDREETFIVIAKLQARSGDRQGAALTFQEVLGAASSMTEGMGVRVRLLRDLAAAQAGVGQGAEVKVWIAKQSSPEMKAWALIGLARGLNDAESAKAK
jgi:hypothetical protein